MRLLKCVSSTLIVFLVAAVTNSVGVSGCGDDSGDGAVLDTLKTFEGDAIVETSGHSRVRRHADPAAPRKRKFCSADAVVGEGPRTRIDTTARLEALRKELRFQNVDAFLIPSGDSHQSEYVAPRDKRRQWIGGFSGSSGFAVVTLDNAAMWTDGRYLIQAENELDCNWQFMLGSEGGDSGWIAWLQRTLTRGSRIGADPSLTGASTWVKWDIKLESAGLTLIPLDKNPIDTVWDGEGGRPGKNRDPLQVLPVKFAGRSWEAKVSSLRRSLRESGHNATVLTALDEIAWLFNMRGSDIPFNPVFKAYAVISEDQMVLYLDDQKQTSEIEDHLKSEDCHSSDCVQLRDYEEIFEELEAISESWTSVLLGKKWAYTGGASYAIYKLIPKLKLEFGLSPVMLMKGRKNEVEIQGMIDANIRDAVALIDLASILDKEIGSVEWDELRVSKELSKKRSEQEHARGDSFQTIAAYGGNGAIIHYKPTDVTSAKIGGDSLFLLDSGGQYLDGTTDVTRTFHYGRPTDFEIDAYTRVLMGSIDLARAVFPKGTPDTRLDILARYHLLRAGLNYRHGTGHGIGAYGFIHESPIQVRVYAKEEHPFEEGQFFSDEPGYYQPNEFGIRLETVLRVVKKENLKHQEKEDYGELLGFEPVCLVPFEPKLIDYTLFSDGQVDWLNRYNRMVREKVGKELKAQGKDKAYQWMRERTVPLTSENLEEFRSSRALPAMLDRSAASPVTLFNAAAMVASLLSFLAASRTL